MAKQISPVTIWVNGQSKTAEYLQVTGTNDNYESAAVNHWQLFTKIVDENGDDKQGESVAQGNLSISGEDYVNWGDQPAMSINEWIYDWTATQLNIVLV